MGPVESQENNFLKTFLFFLFSFCSLFFVFFVSSLSLVSGRDENVDVKRLENDQAVRKNSCMHVKSIQNSTTHTIVSIHLCHVEGQAKHT